jgi:hypothetical protein
MNLFWELTRIEFSDIYTGKNPPRLVYEYDFGDGWQHENILETIVEPGPKVRYPRCIEGARACPPEDVGGIWGYAEFLEAVGDPNHADHDEMVEWVGGKFDPEIPTGPCPAGLIKFQYFGCSR